jgi:phosphoribosylformylglycinamidine cyclo-ligase
VALAVRTAEEATAREEAPVSVKRGLTYRDSGVDIDAQDRALARIRDLLRETKTPETLSDLGSFGGLFRVPAGFEEPVLVASTDGVGTKLKVAFAAGVHHTVGRDLVNHCVNDIFVQGARPLFFLDYVASGRLDPDVLASVVEGIARGCREHGCALLGGETAEMPDFYAVGEYDVAGTIVGIVERAKIVDGKKIVPGDVLIGLPSAGLHTNGYSLARKVFFEIMRLSVGDQVPALGQTVGQVLLEEHRSYYRPLAAPVGEGRVKGLAHITGGGLTDNLPRILPTGARARIQRGTWPVLAVFEVIQREGQVEEGEMFRVFNMGVGMVVVASKGEAGSIEKHLDGLGGPTTGSERSSRGSRVWSMRR